MSLEELVKSYQEGSEKSFDLIYKKTKHIVKAEILSYVTKKEIVLELIDMTYQKFIKNKDAYQEGSFERYIYSLAKEVVLSYIENNSSFSDESSKIQYGIEHLEEDKKEVFLFKSFGFSYEMLSILLNKDIDELKSLYEASVQILDSNISKECKKEFKNVYTKKNRKKILFSRIITISIVSGFALAIALIIIINHITTQNYNNYYTNNRKEYENACYNSLEEVSASDYDVRYNYARKASIWDAIVQNRLLISGFGYNIEPRSFAEGTISKRSKENLGNSVDYCYPDDNINLVSTTTSDSKYFYCVDQYGVYVFDRQGKTIAYHPEDFSTSYESSNLGVYVYKNVVVVYDYYAITIFTFDGASLNAQFMIYELFEKIEAVDDNIILVTSNPHDTNSKYVKTYYDKLSRCNYDYYIYKIDISSLEYDVVRLISSRSACIVIDGKYIAIASDYLYSWYEGMQNIYIDKTLVSLFDFDLNPVGVFAVKGSIDHSTEIDICENTLRVFSKKTNQPILTIFDINQHNIINTRSDFLLNREMFGCRFTDDNCYILAFGLFYLDENGMHSRTQDPMIIVDLKNLEQLNTSFYPLDCLPMIYREFELDGKKAVFSIEQNSPIMTFNIYEGNVQDKSISSVNIFKDYSKKLDLTRFKYTIKDNYLYCYMDCYNYSDESDTQRWLSKMDLKTGKLVKVTEIEAQGEAVCFDEEYLYLFTNRSISLIPLE